MEKADWLEPWSSTAGQEESYLRAFAAELARETRRGHVLHRVPVRLIGRGDGDDALFALMDGTGRVAEVHIVWQGRQKPPWPGTAVFASLEEWREKRMIPAHHEWTE